MCVNKLCYRCFSSIDYYASSLFPNMDSTKYRNPDMAQTWLSSMNSD